MTRHVEQPGPNELRDPVVRQELKRAGVWIGVAVGVILAWVLAQPLLLIMGGIVFAAILDGGARLLGRVLPIGRRWRLLIVALLGVLFFAWVLTLAGTQLADQAQALSATVQGQVEKIFHWAQSKGYLKGTLPAAEIGRQLIGSIEGLTSAVSTAFGALASLAMIIVIGVFLAMEPRMYERGLAWMFPIESRPDLYETMNAMGKTLRRLMAGRLLAMFVEGVATWLLLTIGGVPMAALLGVLTGLFAFLPNIGALVSGTLMILVGFSGGTQTGFWAIGVYLIVHAVDGYVIVPMVAKRSVDLAPALVLGAQLLLGALFGILGLAFADPMVAMIKVALERGSKNAAEDAGELVES
jgi:predicted PurR-regulated permease PerM